MTGPTRPAGLARRARVGRRLARARPRASWRTWGSCCATDPPGRHARAAAAGRAPRPPDARALRPRGGHVLGGQRRARPAWRRWTAAEPLSRACAVVLGADPGHGPDPGEQPVPGLRRDAARRRAGRDVHLRGVHLAGADRPLGRPLAGRRPARGRDRGVLRPADGAGRLPGRAPRRGSPRRSRRRCTRCSSPTRSGACTAAGGCATPTRTPPAGWSTRATGSRTTRRGAGPRAGAARLAGAGVEPAGRAARRLGASAATRTPRPTPRVPSSSGRGRGLARDQAVSRCTADRERTRHRTHRGDVRRWCRDPGSSRASRARTRSGTPRTARPIGRPGGAGALGAVARRLLEQARSPSGTPSPRRRRPSGPPPPRRPASSAPRSSAWPGRRPGASGTPSLSPTLARRSSRTRAVMFSAGWVSLSSSSATNPNCAMAGCVEHSHAEVDALALERLGDRGVARGERLALLRRVGDPVRLERALAQRVRVALGRRPHLSWSWTAARSLILVSLNSVGGVLADDGGVGVLAGRDGEDAGSPCRPEHLGQRWRFVGPSPVGAALS